MEKITNVLEKTFKNLGVKSKIKKEMVHFYWKEVVGPNIASQTESAYLKDGILFVRVENSMWSQQLSFLKQSLINKLNHKLGSHIVKDIYFQVGLVMEDVEKIQVDYTELNKVELNKDQLEKIEEIANEVKDEKIREKVKNILENNVRLTKYKKQTGWVECEICSALFKPREKELRCPICLPILNRRR